MKLKFSVSEIVSAFKCPMHFFLKRKGKNAFFYYPGNENLGTFVHLVLSRFAKFVKKRTLFSQDLTIDTTMKKIFMEVSFSWHGNTDFEKAWQYIEPVLAYFDFITKGKSPDEIADMFVFSEKSFTVDMENTNVTGKFDILLKDGDTFKIIDYKTRKSEIDFDGIQIAIYKYAVEKTFDKKAVPLIISISDGEVYTEKFTEEEYGELIKAVHAKIREMKQIISGEIIPERTAEKEICRHCSMRYSCETFFKEVFQ